MNQFILLLVGIVGLGVGSILGYYARQSIARKKAGTLEQTIQQKISQAKQEAQALISEAKKNAQVVLDKAKKEEDQRRNQLFKTEQFLLKKENGLDHKISNLERREKELHQRAEKLRGIKQSLESLKQEALEALERIAGLSPVEAKKELLVDYEKEYQQEILEKLKKLEKEGKEKLEQRAKEIIGTAIQKCALSQAQELTTTTVYLPSDDIKGRIIGKEGRNIRALEKLTGVELVVDETPEAVTISGFDPIRRQTAKTVLERLIQDGRIQPAKIEEIVQKTEKEITEQIKQAGEQALYEIGIIVPDPKLTQLLGRLKFRTSYGQNVLLHSLEVSHLAAALASEMRANVEVCKKAGLLHDIGKAVDHQIEGSHVDIGMRILEKFGLDQEVISAMKSHHEEYPVESLEAVIVQVADQISGARPGARKDSLENYLKRLQDLERVASSFEGVEKAWALQAGREIRVFVKSEQVDDLAARKLAKEIARRIEEELRYPGEIKVNVIRESRIIEHAK